MRTLKYAYLLGVFLLTLTGQRAIPQPILSSILLDSIIANTIEKNEIHPSLGSSGYTERFVIKIQQDTNSKNSIFFSYTYVVLRRDYPEDASIYYYNKQYYFILFDYVAVNNALEMAIKRPNTERYHQIMDSLDFPYRSLGGVIFERRKLVVYKISKSWLSSRKYKITSKTYIPFSTAPQKFWPIRTFSDEVVHNNTLSTFYIDARRRYTDLYYKEIQPIKPILITVRRQ